MAELEFIPYSQLLAIRIDTFDSEIIDEVHRGLDDTKKLKDFTQKYGIYDNVRIVEIML